MNLMRANEPWLNASAIPDDWMPTRIRNVAQLSPGYSDCYADSMTNNAQSCQWSFSLKPV